MTLVPQDFMRRLAAKHGVSDTELEVLTLALLEGESISAIATNLNLKPEAVRKRLGEVYRKFKITGKGPGKMAKLQQLIIGEYQKQQQSKSANQLSITQPLNQDSTTSNNPQNQIHKNQDWDAAPATEIFYHRSQELNQLKQWILKQNSRLVAIFGLGGIGKTTLSVKLAQEIQDKFDYLIWRSLRHAPLLNDLLIDLIQFLHPQTNDESQKPLLSLDINQLISELISRLRSSRCLIIFDDVETILSTESLAGYYAEGFEKYGELIRRIGTESHQSCLVFASSEKLTDLVSLEGPKVHSLQLVGSEEISHKILAEKGLSGNKEWQNLIQRYSGNPLAIKIISATVKELYNGQVSEFLKNTLFIGDIRYLLDQPFARLSDGEKELMYWLAIAQKPVLLTSLSEKFLWSVSTSELLETMASLGRRSLIEKTLEKGQSLFTLQPVVMKYVTTQLVNQIGEEILEIIKSQQLENINLLKIYPLSQPLIQLTKNTLASRLIRNPKNLEVQINRLESCLVNLSDKSTLEIGYATENFKQFIAEIKSEFNY